MKQNCQTRWFCLHSVSMFLSFSLHGTFHKYKFLVKCLNEFETGLTCGIIIEEDKKS